MKDADEASWRNGDNDRLPYNQKNASLGSALKGQRAIELSDSRGNEDGVLDVVESFTTDAIDIEFAPTFGRKDQEVRGSYTMQLPDQKHIQLELAYDLMVDEDGERSPAAFSVEVFEPNQADKNEWIKTDETNGPDFMSEENNSKIHHIGKQDFTTHHFVVNLSKYRGKEVSIDLVARVSKKAVTNQKARWIVARIISADFSYSLGPVIAEKTAQAKTAGRRGAASKTSSITLGAYEQILIKSATTIPDSQVNTVQSCLNNSAMQPNRWFGYFHGIMEKEGADAVSPIDRRGTMAFDLKNYSSNNLYDISVSNLKNTLLRGTSQAAAAPAQSGTPFLIIKPHDQQWDKWDNWYTAICSNVKATTDSNTRIHAFLHVEDKSQNSISRNEGEWAYLRVGYARSEEDHAYDFDLNNDGETFLMSDSNSSSSMPIIESFFAEENVSGNRKRTNGVGGPSVIKEGDYYYLYFNRQIANADIDSTYSSGNWPANTTSLTDPVDVYWDCICVARAKVNDVINEDYASLPNPWKKKFNGAWNSNGRGGYSSPTMGGSNYTDDWRAYPNVIYDTLDNDYYLICGGPLGLYLYKSDNLSCGWWGTGLLISGMEDYVHYPSLIGEDGDDKEGESDYKLYYAHSVTLHGPKSMRRRSFTIN